MVLLFCLKSTDFSTNAGLCHILVHIFQYVEGPMDTVAYNDVAAECFLGATENLKTSDNPQILK